jgi:hypothetical protein
MVKDGCEGRSGLKVAALVRFRDRSWAAGEELRICEEHNLRTDSTQRSSTVRRTCDNFVLNHKSLKGIHLCGSAAMDRRGAGSDFESPARHLSQEFDKDRVPLRKWSTGGRILIEGIPARGSTALISEKSYEGQSREILVNLGQIGERRRKTSISSLISQLIICPANEVTDGGAIKRFYRTNGCTARGPLAKMAPAPQVPGQWTECNSLVKSSSPSAIRLNNRCQHARGPRVDSYSRHPAAYPSILRCSW